MFNNNIILVKLGREIRFNPESKYLYYMGYIINLIAKVYFFGQNTKSFQEDF
jgi:hypothetical protein